MWVSWIATDVADGIRGDADAVSRAQASLSNVADGMKQTAAGVYNEGPYDYARLRVADSFERIDRSFDEGDYFGATSEGAELTTAVVGTVAGGAGLAGAGATVARAVPTPTARVGSSVRAVPRHADLRESAPATIFEGGSGEIAASKPSSNSTSLVLHQDQVITNNYKRYYAEGWERAVRKFNRGEITIPARMNWQTALGQEVDGFARLRLRRYLAREGISEGRGQDVLVNRWLRDPSGSGEYRIPDVRLTQTGTILDGTIGKKTLETPQMKDMVEFSGGNRIIIVRPRSSSDSELQ